MSFVSNQPQFWRLNRRRKTRVMCGLAVAGLSQDAGAEEQRISEGKERHRAQRRVCIASAVVPVNSAVACGSEAAVLGKKNGDERARVEARIEAAVRGGVVEVELLRSSGQGPREGGVAGRGRWRIRRDAAGGMDGISPAKQRLAIFHHPLHNFLRPPPLTQFSVHTGMTRCLLLKSLSPANPLAAEKWKCFSRGVFTDSRLFSHLNHSSVCPLDLVDDGSPEACGKGPSTLGAALARRH
ncbi:hypothetical protein JOL62DRAFT_560766 [Phyllosticta paracitricarpa]|uniref:Uncharacterized protein n=1 Tax=Phyllosticta paracitricarpa TaxID=2016321 RepID=A0ABR1MS22_9PEZI